MRGWPKGKKRPELSNQMKKNNPMKHPEVLAKQKEKRWTLEQRIKQSTRMKKNNPMKRPEQRERMKNGAAARANSFNRSPSKEQIKLYKQVLKFYPFAILNYQYKNYSIDIAIQKLKIAIEFDGYYWHKGREEIDRKRQEELEKDGWNFIRYRKLPNDNQLNKDLLGLDYEI